jgi:hypothetical protein
MSRRPKKDPKTLASDLRSAVLELESAIEQRNKSNEIYALAKHRFYALLNEIENSPKPRVRKKTDATDQG